MSGLINLIEKQNEIIKEVLKENEISIVIDRFKINSILVLNEQIRMKVKEIINKLDDIINES